jgi:multidrug efflux pump subunit AcrB
MGILVFIASLTLFAVFGKGTEFFPQVEPRRAYIHIKTPEGTNLDASDTIVAQSERIAADYRDIKYIISNVGSVGGDPFSQGGTGTHISRVALDFVDIHDRSRLSSEVVKEIRQRVQESIKGAEVQVEEEEHGPPTGPPVNMEITGEDIRVLGDLADRARKEIKEIPGLVDLKDNFVKGKPEIKVRIDKEKAALLGLDTYTIAYTVKAAINGVKVGVFREGKEEYDILARLPEKDRRTVENLKRITVSGPKGEPIPLTSVAEVSLATGVGAIQRLDQKRMVTVSANVSGRLANDVIRDIKARLAGFPWPRGYSIKFTGEQREQEKARDFLSKAFVGAVAIIFMVLLVEFNSVSTVFIIMTSVILSLIGVFLGLLVCGLPFGIMMTSIGVISLAGVVANNAIVLIDYYNRLLEKGLAQGEALVKASLTRMRPVTLGAITTVVGLIPTAVGVSFDFRKMAWDIGGESSQWWGPMAVAVIFGGIVATLLTLVIVPVLCSLDFSLRERFRSKPKSISDLSSVSHDGRSKREIRHWSD